MAGTITRLEVQKHNPERVSVYLDDTFAFGVDILVAAGMRKGQPLDDDAIAALRADDDRHRAYLAAVRLLGSRPRSREEIERALRTKRYEEPVIEAAIERLTVEGLIDDAEFARFWSENRTTFRPRGTRALRYELRLKGVANEDMEEALEAVDEDEAAWSAVARKAETWRNLPADEYKQKVLAFLARRGFGYSTANGVWKRLQETSEDADPWEGDT
jgi:regulatory protein